MAKSVVVVTLLVILAVVGGVILGQTNLLPKLFLSKPSSEVVSNNSSNSQTPAPADSLTNSKPMFAGTVKKLNQDLGIFNKDYPSFQDIKSSISYYEAGVYQTGKYQGYTRYVAFYRNGPGEPEPIFLASNDNRHFVLDTQNISLYYFQSDGKSQLDKSRVTAVDDLPKEVPDKFVLNDKLVLGLKTIYSEYSFDNELTSPLPSVPLEKIVSPSVPQTFFFKKMVAPNVSGQTADVKTNQNIENKFVETDTNLYFPDSSGLYYQYALANTENFKAFLTAKEEQLVNQKEYVTWVQNGSTGTPPQTWLNTSNLSVQLTDRFDSHGKPNFFKSYGIAFPGACAFDQATRVLKNVSDTNFVAQFDSPDGQLFTLKDQDHDLLHHQYYRKVSAFGEKNWKEFGHQDKYPTFEEYVAKNPLLFFKDPFGRWVALGEYDITLPVGCGKPVIYLYPPTDTQVSLQFTAPVSFVTQIPPYKTGWNIEAKPDGTLIDRNHKVSDCLSFASSQPGSEYAFEACQKNAYPYLYWSGNVFSSTYPTISSGWVVTRENLNSFLTNKLLELGLTNRESSDMLAYWVPRLLKNDYPYFKVSFLVDGQVNQIFPMTIFPKPDSIRRIFLDWKPLSEKPANDLLPQTFPQFKRKGFSMVEWGGLEY